MSAGAGGSPTHPQRLLGPLHLREGMDFDAFVTPEGGEVAVEGVRALAEHGGQLWLWGLAGTGRTHLLEAAVRASAGPASLLPAAELAGLSPAMLEGLESLSLVAFDDVDRLAGDRNWEESLFHVYNRCLDAGTAMVFSAGAAPADCGFILGDLTSRFGAAPVFRLPRLEDTRLGELFCLRAERRGIRVGSEVIAYLLARCERSPAALMELLDVLDRETLVRRRALTIPFIRETLGW